MDTHTPEQRRRNMQAVKNKNSKIECVLRKILWINGFRYRKNCSAVYGKPDIVFVKKKIAIFCDSEFWHGYNWNENKKQIHSNKEFWMSKIERNILRDMEVTEKLKKDGWIVLRFWGKDILKNTKACYDKIVAVIESRNEV